MRQCKRLFNKVPQVPQPERVLGREFLEMLFGCTVLPHSGRDMWVRWGSTDATCEVLSNSKRGIVLGGPLLLKKF